ncbi:hypothetical protein LguiA_028533 [Lonicera macranthoides]
MASSNPNNLSPSVPGSFDPTNPPSTNTTFVQADPSTFRSVVQRLTGATHDPTIQKLPVTATSRSSSARPISADMGPRRPAFKLQERRQGARNLEIKLNTGFGPVSASFGSGGSPSARQRSFRGFGSEMVMVSPVSPLDLFGYGSPRTPMSPLEEEEKAIAEKGFYLHPSPLSTPRGSGSEPELLPLFPLHSPRYNNNNNNPSPN